MFVLLDTRTNRGQRPCCSCPSNESARNGCCTRLLRLSIRSCSFSLSNNFVRPGLKTLGDDDELESADVGVLQEIRCFLGLLIGSKEDLDRSGDMVMINVLVAVVVAEKRTRWKYLMKK